MNKKNKSSSNNKKITKRKPLTTYSAEELIKVVLHQNPKKLFNVKQILVQLNNNKIPQEIIFKALANLLEQGQIIMNEDGKFKLKYDEKSLKKNNDFSQIVEGIIDISVHGNGYLMSEQLVNDAFISQNRLNYALAGDTVRAGIISKNGKKQEAEVIEIIKRATEVFSGTLEINKNFAFVIPDKRNMPVDIFISNEEMKKAKPGDKVAVRVIEWHSAKSKNPKGIILGNIGKEGSNDAEMNSILINSGFDFAFSPEVEKEAEKIPFSIDSNEIKKRRDFRSVLTFTIDPFDAKDFDDAISFRNLDNGNFEIGIHIADVSHYIQPDSLLDKEAYSRSTSVYLVDRCIPMLPEKLSNGVCSLHPNEDKLCYSAVFEMNEAGQVIQNWFGRTVIHSDFRFAYEQAQEILDKNEKYTFQIKDSTLKTQLEQALWSLNTLAYILRKEKFKNGAIAFEAPELKFKLDEKSNPIGMYVKERKDAHMLIEDFMLLANKSVANYIQKKQISAQEIPFIYRIHDTPDTAKLEDFNTFVSTWNYKVDLANPKSISNSLNKIIQNVQGKPEQSIVERMAIRCMAKAVYSSNNIGHYGLAFANYSHFTSPIRRYSDVIAHRLLDKNLGQHFFRTDKDSLEKQCKHISNQERKAMEAERESIKLKQVEFMSNRLNENFEGFISGVHEKGFWVEIAKWGIEGFVQFSSMQSLWQVGKDKISIHNVQTFESLKIGDSIKVKLIKVDKHKRQLDFIVFDEL